MIYLFNSGIRGQYLANVLNTLFLPNGSINEYRYNFEGKVVHVPTGFREYLSTQINSPVVITFIDRYHSGGYFFHPLRKGHFLSYREDGDRLYIRVSLSRFVYPQNLDAYNSNLVTLLGPKGLARLTNNNTEEVDDGFYALYGNDLFQSEKDFYWDNKAWPRIVDDLATCKVFNDSEKEVLFLKSEIKDEFDEDLIPDISSEQSEFKIIRKKSYKLTLTYKYPAQRANNKAQNEFKIIFQDPIKPKNTTIKVDATSNSNELIFQSLKYPEEETGTISFDFPKIEGNKELFHHNKEINMRIVEEKTFWWQIIALVTLYVAFGALIGSDLTGVNTVKDLLSKLSWLKVGFGVLQTIVVVLLLRLMGKKIL